jgi:hypothetical protein
VALLLFAIVVPAAQAGTQKTRRTKQESASKRHKTTQETADHCVSLWSGENQDFLINQKTDALIPCVETLRAVVSRTKEQTQTLSHLEKALRKRGDVLEEAVAGEEKAKKANEAMGKGDDTSSPAEDNSPSDDTSNSDELKLIRSTVYFSNQGLVVNAEKYDDYFFRLNTGYEFVAIDKFFDKGEPRMSLLMNRRMGGDLVTDDRHGLWWRYGGRSTFAAVLESSAEATVKLPDTKTSPKASTTDPNQPADANVTKAFAFELQYTWIFFRTLPFGPNNLREYLGLIVVAGGFKTDAQPKITDRFYYGLRSAVNPEFYADFLYGHTSGLQSNRIEVRGQFPVSTLANGDRIFLGGIGNFAINKRSRALVPGAPSPPESDTVRVYATWNTDLKHLFGQN